MVFYVENETDDEEEDSELLKEEKAAAKLAEEEKHEPMLEVIEKICFLVIWPLSWIMPVKRLPEVALALVFVFIYFLSEFILTVFNVFSVYTGLSHFLVGLTLMVWGSDALELINMMIAVKNKQVEIGMTSVMCTQLLCLLVVIPIAAMSRMDIREEHEIQVL